jgi:cellulose synthase/poly-beta-1,6-N-acetylglucosamine synthase-like glycosyltransferase/peptidoglycan/xylan/chitin deacetylase (PgdA/CDA1 family)
MRWVFAAILGILLWVMLVVAGFASSEVANDAHAHDPGGDSTVPTSVSEGSSVVDATHPRVSSSGMPGRTIALTFDDGPDPTWTPQILSILRKHQVPGTFFVVGSMAARHPDLLRGIRDSGSELGAHTFTHPDLVQVSQWRLDRELDESQLVLAGGAGVTTNLFRPPFSSSASAIDDLGYGTVLAAGRHGYVCVFTDRDSGDWGRPGVEAIMRGSTPVDGQGAIVLMHDAGGERSQTVAALDRLIPRLQQEGYRFTTVSGGLGLPPANQPASAADQRLGKLLLAAVAVSLGVVGVLQAILLAVGLLVVARLVLMVIVARGHARRRHHPRWRWGPPVTAPVSVIVPAFNEAANIEVAIRSIVANGHPLEVLLVDDGSTDGTADLVEGLGLPGVRVIRQPNGGKAAALNTGIAHARHDLVVMVDGDTVFARDSVHHLVQPFADPAIGAVAGNVKIANRDTFLTRLQHIEYVVGFNVDRRVHDVTGSMPTIPGAAGAFRRTALIEAGGLSGDTLAEDTDLTLAIGRAGWRTVYEDRAIAWTEAPSTLNALWQQRFRWTYGTMQALWKHRRAIVERGAAGRLGRFGLLHVLAFQILLPITAPLIDVFLVYGLFFLDPGTTLVLWLSVMLLQTAGAAIAFHLDGEPTGPLWLMPAQQLIYRQLMYVVLGQSLAAAASGVLVRWQRMRRTGALEAMLRAPDPPRVPSRRPAIAPTTATEPVPGREHGIHLLVVIALAVLVTHHLTGWDRLSLAYPAMGVLFAAGACAMARSLRRTSTVDAVGHRLRGLLPPLWVLGLVMVPLMLAHGWGRGPGDTGSSWAQLAFWVFPVLDPPGGEWGADITSVLWFVRACLWFVLLTPALLRALHRWPVITVLAPATLVALDTAAGSVLAGQGPLGAGILDFGVFGSCWLLGLAHGEGVLHRLHPLALAGFAAAGLGLGGWWAATHPGVADLNDLPLGQALFSAGAVVLLLRTAPATARLERIPGLGWCVRAISTHALTVYLWLHVAIALASVTADRLRWPSAAAHAWIALAFLAGFVLALGWVEGLAARRPPRPLPGRPRQGPADRWHGPPGLGRPPATGEPAGGSSAGRSGGAARQGSSGGCGLDERPTGVL